MAQSVCLSFNSFYLTGKSKNSIRLFLAVNGDTRFEDRSWIDRLVLKGSNEKYQCTIEWRNGKFIADAPARAVGKDNGLDLSLFCCHNLHHAPW